jgi:hypothetical protein
MLQIEEDLRGIDTTRSVLVLEGRTQAASLNADDLSAGVFHRELVGTHDPNDPNFVPPSYDPRRDPGLDTSGFYSNPRADVLGFFTARPTVSQAPPRSPSGAQALAYARGTKFAPTYVAYGHAAIAEPVLTGNTWTFGPAIKHIQPANNNLQQLSPLPLTGWHLARRATIIENADVSNLTLANPNFDALRRCHTTDPALAADVGVMNFEAYLESATGLVARAAPYGPGFPNGLSATQINFFADEMLYGVKSGPAIASRHLATVLPEPPAELRDNLGVHMLPACAWFQVEFLMPEDVRNSPDYIDQRPGLTPAIENRRDDMPLWTSVIPGQKYIFVPDNGVNRSAIAQQFVPSGPIITPPRPFTSMTADAVPLLPGETPLTHRRIRTWPYAIRVTVRVYDERNRLSSPIVRSLVHRFD